MIDSFKRVITVQTKDFTLNSNMILFQSEKFSFKLNHLIIIGVLVLAFSTSMLIRSQPIEYGFELNEFDPFFNFRATEYIVENGLSEYFAWHDDKSWYPNGRNVSATSQIMLHVTAAITYQIFGGNFSLYDYTILFPAIIGSLTVIVIFGLVRLFGGTTAGLIASLLFAISLPIILRGSIGWFKSEPLGIFYGLLGLYLFLSAINSNNKKSIICKIIPGAIIMAFGMASWGGNQFFLIPVGLFIFILPFVKKDHKSLFWCIPLFTGVFLLIISSFERPGINFVFGLGGFSLILPTLFLVASIFTQKLSKNENKLRNNLFLFLGIIIIFSSLLIINQQDPNNFPLPSIRYLNALNPLFDIKSLHDPLVTSVAEHTSTSIQMSFLLHSVWMIFAGLGIWFLLSKKISENFIKNDLNAFVLIFAITGVYISSSFVRLELLASISLIILSSIGLSVLTKRILKIKNYGKQNLLLKSSYVLIILFLFSLPLTIPENMNWISIHDNPPAIFTGVTDFPPKDDWLQTLEWIKNNTPENAIIASWWDYGYWITTMSDRTTIVDNATLNTKQIQKMAKVLMSTPEQGWHMLQDMNADYLLVFFAATDIEHQTSEFPLYVVSGGGDESKVYWFSAIAENDPKKFLYSDNITPTPYFYENSLMGKLYPFSTVLFYNPTTGENSQVYKNGFVEITRKNIKYDSDDDPLKLVYSSPSFFNDSYEEQIFVLVYQVNKNYNSYTLN